MQPRRRCPSGRPLPLAPLRLLPTHNCTALARSWARNAAAHGSRVALEDPHHPGPPAVTYAELAALITDFGAGLRSLGLEPGERVRGRRAGRHTRAFRNPRDSCDAPPHGRPHGIAAVRRQLPGCVC